MSNDRHDAKVGSENRDPLTGEAGAHPVGTGLGAAGAGAAGAALGSVAGPVGTVVGAVVGAVAGGLAGKGVAESVDPTVEHAHWEKAHTTRPYYEKGHSYEDYRPAYQYGIDSHAQHHGRSWEHVEADLGRDWDRVKAHSKLNWEKAKGATRDAWDRVADR